MYYLGEWARREYAARVLEVERSGDAADMAWAATRVEPITR